MSALAALEGGLGRHSRHRSAHQESFVKKKKLEERISGMSREEALGIIANLQVNMMPPYRLHTHPTEFIIHAFGADCSARVNTHTSAADRAWRELGMSRIQEIADTVLRHPALGAQCLEAMMDGRKVVINVERLTTPATQQKKVRTVSQVADRGIEQHLLN